MIRIEELSSGVYRIDRVIGATYEQTLEALEPDIFNKFMILRVVDIHTRIEGIGTRLGDNLYWITEEGDDASIGAEIRGRLMAALNKSDSPDWFGLHVELDFSTITYRVRDVVTGTLFVISVDDCRLTTSL